MNIIKKDNLITLTLETAARENNFLDDDQIQEGINNLRKAETNQQSYEAMNYISICLSYRGYNQSALLIKDWANEFADEMSLAEHIANNNSEAIARFEEKAKNQEVVRIF